MFCVHHQWCQVDLTAVRFDARNYYYTIYEGMPFSLQLSSFSFRMGAVVAFVYCQCGCHSILTEHRWVLVWRKVKWFSWIIKNFSENICQLACTYTLFIIVSILENRQRFADRNWCYCCFSFFFLSNFCMNKTIAVCLFAWHTTSVCTMMNNSW